MTPEELHAWDIYYAAAVQGLFTVAGSLENVNFCIDGAKLADIMLIERRKRYEK